MTCHNRVNVTIKCLKNLYSSQLDTNISFEVYLVDDGSKDDTSRLVKLYFPKVNIIFGDGNLYWNRGMSLAYEYASRDSVYDYYLWLNDDTLIFKNSLLKMMRCELWHYNSYNLHSVIVGATRPCELPNVNYGGILMNKGWLSARLINPTQQPISCDTFNGNCVLIPKKIYEDVGNLDPIYIHAIGDIDFGLRVKRNGFTILQCDGFCGYCESNEIVNTYLDTTLPLYKRLKLVLSIKNRPLVPWMYFHLKNFGLIGILYFSATYIKIILSSITKLIR